MTDLSLLRNMARKSLSFCILAISLTAGRSIASSQNAVDLKPTPQQTAWQDLEFGVILHFGTNTFLDREWGDGSADPKVFNPTQFDPDQWMKAIKASGAKYVVFVAKHHDGYCLWPTGQTDYSIKQSAWKNGNGDMVREVADAARANGLKFGVYLSPWDRHEPKYKDPAAYDKYYNAQLSELASNYGDLVEFWLDGAGSTGRTYDFPTIINTLRTYQPNTIVFADTGLFEFGDARWAGTESGKIEYENWNVVDRHGYLRWRPVEADTPLRKNHWFWHPNDEQSLKSVDELLDSYEHTVGHGGQWLIGIAPDSRGLIPDVDAARLRELGAAIKTRYAKNLLADHLPVDANTANALDSNLDTFWSAPAGSHSATLEVRLPKPITFDSADTMEWLVEGQQIQQYSIDVWQDGQWRSLLTGQAIGHRKIDSFASTTTTRVRLKIIASAGEAHIREFALHSSGRGAGNK